MVKISAFIITKNEAHRIAKAINSVKDIVDELIIIDSGSTDETVSLAKSLGARVVFNEWSGYVNQKSFGEQLCKNDWILNIDADEALSPNLSSEISNLFQSNSDDVYAYTINIAVIHRNDKDQVRKYAPSNRVIRLYNKKYASFSNVLNSTTHDAVIFNKDIEKKAIRIGKLKNPIYHRSVTSIEQLINKINFYSTEQAKDMFFSKRKPSMLRIIFELPLHFLKVFIIRRYFIFGFDGVIDSIIIAFARFLRLAKARELYKQKDIKSTK